MMRIYTIFVVHIRMNIVGIRMRKYWGFFCVSKLNACCWFSRWLEVVTTRMYVYFCLFVVVETSDDIDDYNNENEDVDVFVWCCCCWVSCSSNELQFDRVDAQYNSFYYLWLTSQHCKTLWGGGWMDNWVAVVSIIRSRYC